MSNFSPFPSLTSIVADVCLDGFASGATWDSSARTLTGTMPSDLDGVATTALDSGDVFNIIIADVTGDKCGLFFVQDGITSGSSDLVLVKYDEWETRNRSARTVLGDTYAGYAHDYVKSTEAITSSQGGGGGSSTGQYERHLNKMVHRFESTTNQGGFDGLNITWDTGSNEPGDADGPEGKGAAKTFADNDNGTLSDPTEIPLDDSCNWTVFFEALFTDGVADQAVWVLHRSTTGAEFSGTGHKMIYATSDGSTVDVTFSGWGDNDFTTSVNNESGDVWYQGRVSYDMFKNEVSIAINGSVGSYSTDELRAANGGDVVLIGTKHATYMSGKSGTLANLRYSEW